MKDVEQMTDEELFDEFRSKFTAGRNGKRYNRERLRRVSGEINRREFRKITQEETQ